MSIVFRIRMISWRRGWVSPVCIVVFVASQDGDDPVAFLLASTSLGVVALNLHCRLWLCRVISMTLVYMMCPMSLVGRSLLVLGFAFWHTLPAPEENNKLVAINTDFVLDNVICFNVLGT